MCPFFCCILRKRASLRCQIFVGVDVFAKLRKENCSNKVLAIPFAIADTFCHFAVFCFRYFLFAVL